MPVTKVPYRPPLLRATARGGEGGPPQTTHG
jgi:hypothetical protein